MGVDEIGIAERHHRDKKNEAGQLKPRGDVGRVEKDRGVGRVE